MPRKTKKIRRKGKAYWKKVEKSAGRLFDRMNTRGSMIRGIVHAQRNWPARMNDGNSPGD